MISTIVGFIIAYAVVVLIIFIVDVSGFDVDFTDNSVIAQIILWPLTIVIYLVLILVWLCKHLWDTIILGYWEFLQSIPDEIRKI